MHSSNYLVFVLSQTKIESFVKKKFYEHRLFFTVLNYSPEHIFGSCSSAAPDVAKKTNVCWNTFFSKIT